MTVHSGPAGVYDAIAELRGRLTAEICRCGCLRDPDDTRAAEHEAAHVGFAQWLADHPERDREPRERVFVHPGPLAVLRMVAAEKDPTCFVPSSGRCHLPAHSGMPPHPSTH